MRYIYSWIWGFYSVGYEDIYLLEYNSMQPCDSSDVSDEHIVSIFMVDE
jgi:hypothetical protein